MTDLRTAPVITQSPDLSSNRVVVLGKIRTAVGLAGWVKVESFTDPADNILQYRVWQLGLAEVGLLTLGSSTLGLSTQWRAAKWLHSRWSGQGLQVQIEGVTERNGAELLRNLDIGVLRHELPPPAPGEYYWDDLLGLTAYTAKGECLGQLDHFQDSPAHPYMVLRNAAAASQSSEHYVPLAKGRILAVDFAQRSMTLDWTLDWIE